MLPFVATKGIPGGSEFQGLCPQQTFLTSKAPGIFNFRPTEQTVDPGGLSLIEFLVLLR
jgi:hypothetical protein